MAGRLLTSQLCILAENRGTTRLFRRLPPTNLQPKCQRLSTTSARNAKKDDPPEEEDPGPVKFTSSKGAQWKVSQTMNMNRNRPLRKVVPVSVSLIAVLLYFCVFRKESWLDRELETSLYARLPGLMPPGEEEEEIDEDTSNDSVTGQEVATTPAS